MPRVSFLLACLTKLQRGGGQPAAAQQAAVQQEQEGAETPQARAPALITHLLFDALHAAARGAPPPTGSGARGGAGAASAPPLPLPAAEMRAAGALLLAYARDSGGAKHAAKLAAALRPGAEHVVDWGALEAAARALVADRETCGAGVRMIMAIEVRRPRAPPPLRARARRRRRTLEAARRLRWRLHDRQSGRPPAPHAGPGRGGRQGGGAGGAGGRWPRGARGAVGGDARARGAGASRHAARVLGAAAVSLPPPRSLQRRGPPRSLKT